MSRIRLWDTIVIGVGMGLGSFVVGYDTREAVRLLRETSRAAESRIVEVETQLASLKAETRSASLEVESRLAAAEARVAAIEEIETQREARREMLWRAHD